MNEEQVIQIIEKYLAGRKQQLVNPIDETSKNLIQKNLPVFQSSTTNTPTADGYITVRINGQSFNILTGQ